jgi:hypothetical protein
MGDRTDEFDPMRDELPANLREDLASLYAAKGGVPANVSDAILNRAHAQLAGLHRSSRPRTLRWLAAAAAAAACVALVGRVVLRSPVWPEDIDGNHRVDIVDALKLAHQINSGQGRDLNGDGVADRRDVDTIAVAVVRLDTNSGGVQ